MSTAAARRPAFPELIDPWRPFVSIREITHRAGGLDVTCRLEGDEFEMEDQRNWSDASFKTYGRPLELPWPYVLPAGEPVAQSVTVSVRRSTAPAGARRTRPVAVEIGGPLGVRFPEVGLVVTAAEVPAALAALDRLKEVGPQRILCAFDPTAGDGAEALAAFARLQAAYPARYDLECVVVGDGRSRRGARGRRARASRTRGSRSRRWRSARRSIASRRRRGARGRTARRSRRSMRRRGRPFPGVTLGGGMFSYFTELNRKRPPVALLDFVTHATNPIVHAADDDSVMETLEALPHITRSTRAIIGALPYRIGPSTIAMRQNPYGSRTIPNPEGERVAMADDDPRQRGRFAAAWTAGYAAAIAPAGMAVWVPAAFTGPRGLLDADGALLPVGEVVRDLARLAGAEVLAAGPPLPRRFAVLAVRDGGGDAGAARQPLARAAALRARRGADARAVRGAADRARAMIRARPGRLQGRTDPGWLIRSSPRPQDGEGGDKIVRRKLSDQVLERMQDLILSGEIGPGETLPSEHELMDRFGVGRPAVREALQSLQTMGLITISHGERSRVNELTPDAVLRQGDAVARMLLTSAPENLEDLKQARWLFELGMVRVGAPRATAGGRRRAPAADRGAAREARRSGGLHPRRHRLPRASRGAVGEPDPLGGEPGDARVAVPLPLGPADLVGARGHHARRARRDRRCDRGARRRARRRRRWTRI